MRALRPTIAAVLALQILSACTSRQAEPPSSSMGSEKPPQAVPVIEPSTIELVSTAIRAKDPSALPCDKIRTAFTKDRSTRGWIAMVALALLPAREARCPSLQKNLSTLDTSGWSEREKWLRDLAFNVPMNAETLIRSFQESADLANERFLPEASPLQNAMLGRMLCGRVGQILARQPESHLKVKDIPYLASCLDRELRKQFIARVKENGA